MCYLIFRFYLLSLLCEGGCGQILIPSNDQFGSLKSASCTFVHTSTGMACHTYLGILPHAHMTLHRRCFIIISTLQII